jgi:uncharacterized protein YjbI with pentapeptide repeats
MIIILITIVFIISIITLYIFTNEEKSFPTQDNNLDGSLVAGSKVANFRVADSTVADFTVASSTVAGSLVAGSRVAGSRVAGSNLAGSNLAGSRVAGSRVAGSLVAGSLVAGSRVAGSLVAGSNLAESNLAESNLAESNLVGSLVAESNLAESNLVGSKVAGSKVAGSLVAGSNLAESNLVGSLVAGSNLAESNIAGSLVAGSNLAESNIAGSLVAGSNLAGSILAHSNLAGSNLAGSILAHSNLAGSNLAGSILAHSNLAGSNLAGSNLAGSILAHSNLAGSNLAGSNLAGSNLAGSNLAASILAGSNLAASNLPRSLLAGSISANLYNINNDKIICHYPFDKDLLDYSNLSIRPSISNSNRPLLHSSLDTKLSTGSALFSLTSNAAPIPMLARTRFTNNGITIAFWIKINETLPINNYRHIISIRYNLYIGIANINLQSKLVIFFQDNTTYTTTNRIIIDLPSNLVFTEWNHFCFIFTPENNPSVFVNGNNILLNNLSNNILYPYINNTTVNIEIGNWWKQEENLLYSGGLQPNWLQANINQIILYNRILTETEISYLYNFPANIITTSSPSRLSASELVTASNLPGSLLTASNIAASNLAASNLPGSLLAASNLPGSLLTGSLVAASNLPGSLLAASNFVSSTLANPYNINNDNIKMYYPFDTNKLNYTTGVGVDNTQVNSNIPILISTSTTKLTSGSLSFIGNASIQLPGLQFTNNGITIAFWIKFNEIPNNSTILSLTQGVFLHIKINAKYLGYSITNSLGANVTANTSYMFNDTNWHHVCFTFTPAGVFSIYVDFVKYSIASSVYPTTTTNLIFNYINKLMPNEQYFNGNMNQFIIYNRVLTETEISYLYNFPANITITSSPSRL